jgi:peroxiredoxin/YHS domain-containing protein
MNVGRTKMHEKSILAIPRIVATVATFFPFAIAMAVTAPADFEFRAGDDSFRLSEARGKFVAIHFLPAVDCTECLEYVNASMRLQDESAGLVQVFVIPAADESVLAFRTTVERGGATPRVYADTDGKIAAEFGIQNLENTSQRVPATIVIGPDGTESFRYAGAHGTDLLPVVKLYSQVDRLSTNPDLDQYNLNKREPALQGYDPVAYFESKSSQKGQSNLISRHRGVTYQFANEGNRRKFATDPDRYLPTYGGWCATAMAEGRKVEIDPTNFKITNGRLFLFYKGWLGNARKDWDKNESEFTRRADEHWGKLAPSERFTGKR